MNKGVSDSCTCIIGPNAKSSWSFFSIIAESLSAEARLFDNIKALEEPSYLSSAPKQKIIGRCILRPLRK